MIIRAAFATSTPTSTTVVATNISALPDAKAAIAASFSFVGILPWTSAMLSSGNTFLLRISWYSFTDFI
jgi:hypothetical protein